MPYCLATFSAVMPSEIVHSLFMRGLVKRHPTVESAIAGTSRFHGAPDFSITYGARVLKQGFKHTGNMYQVYFFKQRSGTAT